MRKKRILIFISVSLLILGTFSGILFYKATQNEFKKSHVTASNQVDRGHCENITHYLSYFQFEAPGSYTDKITIDSSRSHCLFYNPWCTKGSVLIEDTLELIDFALIINGKVVPQENYQQSVYSTYNPGYCLSWDVALNGFEKNTITQIEILMTLRDHVDNGEKILPAGKYRRIIIIQAE